MSSRMGRSIVRADVWSSTMTMFKASFPMEMPVVPAWPLPTYWRPVPAAASPCTLPPGSGALLGPHVREQQDVADRGRTGDQHHQRSEERRVGKECGSR